MEPLLEEYEVENYHKGLAAAGLTDQEILYKLESRGWTPSSIDPGTYTQVNSAVQQQAAAQLATSTPDGPTKLNAGTADPATVAKTDRYGGIKFGGLAEGQNRITGGYGLDTLPAWLGGKDNVGIVSGVGSLVGTAATVGKTVLAYKEFQQNKINNEKKLALMQESNAMKVLQMKNRVNQANRYAMLGMSNSNNQTATTGIVGSTAYVAPRYSRVG